MTTIGIISLAAGLAVFVAVAAALLCDRAIERDFDKGGENE